MERPDPTGELDDVLVQLKQREPLYHRREVVGTADELEREVAGDFWEVGASGRVYDREFVIRTVEQRLSSGEPDMAVTQGWQTSDHAVRPLGPDTYLFTYLLDAGTQNRITRRATIWQRTAGGWQAQYHQGTVVAGDR